MIKKLCIVGVGLIGGSLALALKKHAYVQTVVGIGRDAKRLAAAQAAGIIDIATDDYAQCQDADVILVAVPLGAFENVFAQIKPYLTPDTVLTDAGSAKACVVNIAQRVFGHVPENFVPGHPIAGTEKSGFSAAFAELYLNRRVVLTPVTRTADWARARVQAMWQAAGAVVEVTTVEHHDLVLAETSHLPHILAFGLVDSLAKQKDAQEIFRFAAGGFRDFTRIAASDPVMWRDICLYNRDAILQALKAYESDLSELHAAIEKGDGDSLEIIFARAKAVREQFNF
ncbi:MAG: prephenate dehydrogenase/arogenate dehydrogenase family protein [Gammaproteobacteria bacterium]|nr:prephenate dehydrogenase/arogenate dehydrogenase family protein [Gammaproteobacteria bacterium]